MSEGPKGDLPRPFRPAFQKGDHLLDEGIAVSMARARRPAEAILALAQARCPEAAQGRRIDLVPGLAQQQRHPLVAPAAMPSAVD